MKRRSARPESREKGRSSEGTEQEALRLHERVVDGLSDPDVYPGHVEKVDVRRTNISVLFFAGARVYKLKRPVALDFLDYTVLDDRRHYCEEEVRLNRRLAPRTYLGVRSVTLDDSGAIRIDGAGTVVDWVVEMERLPADRMLEELLERGEVGPEEIEAIAIVLARFHERSMTGPTVNRSGIPAAIESTFQENLEQLRELCTDLEPSVRPAGRALSFLADHARRFVRDKHDLLVHRVAEWRIREGHGDLHASNICLVGDRVVVYDCIEFDRGLRCGDVASDLAFLTMDLDHRGRPDLAADLARTYATIAADPEVEILTRFYGIHRALVRAKVELLRSLDAEISRADRTTAAREGRRYAQLAVGYALPPSLVLLCGPPGVGKSVVAAHVAGRLRADLLRSDVVRDGVVSGGDGSNRRRNGYGRGRYTDRSRKEVYVAMLEAAATRMRRGHAVVVDASFALREWRVPFTDAASRLRLPLYVLQVDAPDEVVRARLSERESEPSEPSEAGWEVSLGERARFEPPTELSPERVVQIDGTRPAADGCSELQARMIETVGTRRRWWDAR